MPFTNLQMQIIDHDLCTSCGLCVAICPKKILLLDDTSEIPLPNLRNNLYGDVRDCDFCNLCLDICPGFDTGTAKSEKRIFGRERTLEERWIGISRGSYQLKSTDANILQEASSGGIGTTLAVTALENNLVDAFIVIGRNEEKPWIPKALLTKSTTEVVQCAQSSYCIAPNLHLLSHTNFSKIGIVGLPCQIQGINKLLNNRDNPHLFQIAEKIVLTIELACSSSTKLSGTEFLITHVMGIQLDDVVKMKYREGSYPGDFTVVTKDGQKHTLPFYRLVEEFKQYKTFRCLSCPDWWSGLADISIADGDPNIFATSRDKKYQEASSTVLVRTSIGEQLLSIAESNGKILKWPYIFHNNLGLERKRQRYWNLLLTAKRKIPMASGSDIIASQPITDDEVIEYGI